MSATQDGILGRPKAEWTPSRDAYLVELFIEQHNCGRTAYNEFKVEVYKSVTNDFNRKFGMNLEENQIKNRYNVMKKDYGIVKTLLSHPGFAWDDIRQMVVADDKIWDSYIAVRSDARPFRRKSFPLYKQMSIIFEGERPSGRYQFPSGVLLEPEEENSNTETVRSSEPSNLPTQVVDGALDSDSIFHINDVQPKKRKSTGPVTSSRKRRACDRVGDKLENVLYEMFSAASFKCLQRNAIKEQTMYQKCLEELQPLLSVMCSMHALQSLMKPPLLLRFISSTAHSIVLNPIPKPLCFHSSRRLAGAVIAMAGSNSSAGGSSSDHVAGAWYSVPDLRLRDHYFTVPLDYSLDCSTCPKISIFAREVVSVGKEEQPLPFLLYLQGGPGFESPRPTEGSGWISKACEEYRVVLLDQRGTGLSTPLTASSMMQMKSPEDLTNYLKHFRADNIVNDAEFIRVHLVPDAGPWTILGQSFGGFCAVTYLSFAPKGLKQVLLTGGIPPIGSGCTADTVYSVCFEQIFRQNEKYYKRFPQDIEIVREVVTHLAEHEGGGVPLPSGGILTPRGLQLLGLSCLGSSTGFERLHYMLERVWDPIIIPGAQKQISYYFLTAYERSLDFDTNPLFALLHESIYCQGASSRWSAHRIRAKDEGKFDAMKAAKEGRPVLFTGEMIFPWMFEEIHALRPFKDAANLLAEKEDWPPLYDIDSLNNNKVPVAAAVYYEDMYVNFKLVMETASQIAGIRLWITNEFMHSGLRDGGSQVFDHLMGILSGKKPLF